MADQTKRARQKERRRAQQAAVLAARKRQARRRLALRVLLVGVLAAGVVAAVLSLQGDEDEEEVATDTTAATTTSVAARESAAGKPCVAMADTPPSGAPVVPTKVGPPPSALLKEDLKVGTGAPVTPTATVTVNYIGVACSTGRIFDASYSRGQPVSFPLNQVIKGWQDGLAGMNVGGQRLLAIPPDQAYGKAGTATIAPDETLWFVVELVGVSG